jgi:hypothetical protein
MSTKTYTPQSVTTGLPDSTGVRPVWMGSCGRPSGGFSKLRQRNGTRCSYRAAQEIKSIQQTDLARQAASRAVMGARPDDTGRLTQKQLRRLYL